MYINEGEYIMTKNDMNSDYTNFNDIYYDDDYVSKEDRQIIEFEVELVKTLIDTREALGISQRKLSELSGVKQPAIARLESLKAQPQVDTLLKILVPLGYKIDIVPIER